MTETKDADEYINKYEQRRKNNDLHKYARIK